MKFLQRVAALLLMASLSATAPQVQAKPAPSSLELGQRLQVMAQRQAKLFLQLRLSVDAETAQRKLDEAVRHFDATLAQLAQQRGQNGMAEIEPVNAIWTSARATLIGAADPATATKAARDAEALTQALQRFNQQLLPASPSPALKLNLTAARDAMLAQKLAKIYLQLRGGEAGVERRNELAQARQEFLVAVETLDRSPVMQAGIRANIDLVRQQWAFFETALSTSGLDNKAMRTVVSTSERMSQTLSDIADAYATLAGDQPVIAQSAR